MWRLSCGRRGSWRGPAAPAAAQAARPQSRCAPPASRRTRSPRRPLQCSIMAKRVAPLCSKHRSSSCIHRGEETALEQPAGGGCDSAADSGVAADVPHLLRFLWRPPPPVAAHRAPAAAALAAARRPPSAARPPWSTPAASHPGRKAEQMTSPCHSAVAVKAMVQASKKVVVRSVRLPCCSVHTVDTALPEAQGGCQAALPGERLEAPQRLPGAAPTCSRRRRALSGSDARAGCCTARRPGSSPAARSARKYSRFDRCSSRCSSCASSVSSTSPAAQQQ